MGAKQKKPPQYTKEIIGVTNLRECEEHRVAQAGALTMPDNVAFSSKASTGAAEGGSHISIRSNTNSNSADPLTSQSKKEAYLFILSKLTVA